MKSFLVAVTLLVGLSPCIAKPPPPSAEFSHFIPKRAGRVFEGYHWWNGNYVSRDTHALSDPWRYRRMPAEWKAANELYDPITKWFFRVPRKPAIVGAILIDAGIRSLDVIDTEHDFADGQISEVERELAHARNVGGMVGGWIGGWCGGTAGGVAGTFVAPGPGTAVGATVGGTAGYCYGDHVGSNLAERGMRKVINDCGTVPEIVKCTKGAARHNWDELKEATCDGVNSTLGAWRDFCVKHLQ